MSKGKYRVYTAENIIPKDDAFHESPRQLSLEWWYFDAIFTNGYSIHIGCKINTRKKRGLANPMIEIYKNGKIQALVKKWFRFANIETSKNIPLVKLFNKPIIRFDDNHYKKTDEWIYYTDFKIKDCWAKLKFHGISKGFKIETERESWTVALPRAKVTGKICLNGEIIQVDGIGYHDHNWNYTILTAMDYGKSWYWGKVRTKSYDIIFAKIIKSSKKFEDLAIVIDGNKNFFNIHPKNIEFIPSRYICDHRKKIPTYFKLKFEELVEDTPIKVDITMNGSNYHYNRVIVAPYWRYHANIKGTIQVGNKTEKTNNTEIIEFLTFS